MQGRCQEFESPKLHKFDAALIDLDLGPQSLNGIEIGLILKEKNPDIGIVIFTQHVVPDFMDNLPDRYNMGGPSLKNEEIFQWTTSLM